MRLNVDVMASLTLGACCVVLLAAHSCAGAPARYRRVVQQGATFFLGFNLMHAGYWMLQPVVRLFSKRRVAPALISWISLLPALGASLAAAIGHWGIAAWCLLASALLDVLDGAVARAIGELSPAGAVLDSALDRYAEFLFFCGLLVYYRDFLSAQLLAVAALFGSFLVTYSTAKAEALQTTPPRGSMKRSDRLTVLILGTALTPLSNQWLEKPTSPFAWPVLTAITLIAVLANVSAIRRFTALSRAVTRPSVRATMLSPAPEAETPRTKSRRYASARPAPG
jgi:CDP-diacylglycerol---glycerol-3-phosphate 3-phosphatidyltransferase